MNLLVEVGNREQGTDKNESRYTELVLSRDTSKNLQDGLESSALYRFQQFSSKIDRRVLLLSIYRYKTRSIY